MKIFAAPCAAIFLLSENTFYSLHNFKIYDLVNGFLKGRRASILNGFVLEYF